MYRFIECKNCRDEKYDEDLNWKEFNKKIEELTDGYSFAQFCCKENNFSGFSFSEKSIWYSYDDDSKNFHIVPDPNFNKKEGDEYFSRCQECFSEINKKLPKECQLKLQRGIKIDARPWIKLHQFKSEDVGNYQYLLSFNRLWCDNEKHIHNNFGQVQFMRYRIKCDSGKELAGRYQNINWAQGPEFQMMYPDSAEDANWTYDKESGHVVYNYQYKDKQKNLKDLNDEEIGNIAEAFKAFINGKIIDFKTGELIIKS